MKSSKEITLCTPQGIGDIFWIYQKFAPYFEKIHFSIFVLEDTLVQTRSRNWVSLLPQVSRISFRTVSAEHYQELLTKNFPMECCLEQAQHGEDVDYQVNTPLEHGIRLEDVDQQHEIYWDIPVKIEECNIESLSKGYVCVYVSGSINDEAAAAANSLWSAETWTEFVLGFRRKYSLDTPVVLIGAAYDESAMQTIKYLLSSHMEVITFVGETPAKVLSIIKNSTVFLNYQSGLSIMADNIDVKQVMMYFPRLEKMQYTWCKKRNIKTLFHADLFCKSPDEVINSLTLII